MGSNKFVAFHRGRSKSIMASSDFTHAAQANVLCRSLASGERDEIFDHFTNRHRFGRLKKHTARGEIQSQTLDVIESVAAADQFERESEFESLVLSVFNHVSHLIYKGRWIRSRRMRADSNGCPLVLRATIDQVAPLMGKLKGSNPGADASKRQLMKKFLRNMMGKN